MKTLQIVSLLCCLALAAACGKEEINVSFALNQSFELPYGGRAICLNEDVGITFLNVVEDNRCPLEFICFSSIIFIEKVVVSVKIETGGEEQQIELSLREPVVIGDYRIEMKQLSHPERYIDKARPYKYRGTLTVSPL